MRAALLIAVLLVVAAAGSASAAGTEETAAVVDGALDGTLDTVVGLVPLKLPVPRTAAPGTLAAAAHLGGTLLHAVPLLSVTLPPLPEVPVLPPAPSAPVLTGPAVKATAPAALHAPEAGADAVAAPESTLLEAAAFSPRPGVEDSAAIVPGERSSSRSAAGSASAVAPSGVFGLNPVTTAVVVAAGAAATGALVVLLGLLSILRKPEEDILVGTRRDVYDMIKANPGVTAAELATRTGFTHQTITYHLTVLTASRLAVAQGRGARKFYFVNGSAFSPEERRLMSVIKDRETMEVLKLVVDQPGLCKKDLAESLGVSRQTVNWHLGKLEEAGLVAETKDGTSRHLAPALPDLPVSASRIAQRLGDPALSPWRAIDGRASGGVAMPPAPALNAPLE